jgi:FF domain
MLKRVTEIDGLSKWRIIEPLLRHHPEFHAVEDDRERQRLFEDYVDVRANGFRSKYSDFPLTVVSVFCRSCTERIKSNGDWRERRSLTRFSPF